MEVRPRRFHIAKLLFAARVMVGAVRSYKGSPVLRAQVQILRRTALDLGGSFVLPRQPQTTKKEIMKEMDEGLSKEKARVYEMLLLSPGMADSCRIVLQLSRKQVLLAASLLEFALHHVKDAGAGQPVVPEGSAESLQALADELIDRGGLREFYARWKSF